MHNGSFEKYKVSYKKGEKIFQEGELGTEMYIIHSGKVRIYKDIDGYDQTLSILEKGDFFGEMAVLEGLPRTASAEAEEDCVLIKINSANFISMIKANTEIAIRIMRKLSLKLREATAQIEKLMHASTSIFSNYDAPNAVEEEKKEANKAIAYLVSTMTGHTYALTKKVTTLGRLDKVTGARPDIDLSEEDPKKFISRRHAIILWEEGEFKILEEIGAVNGTYVNNKKLPNGVPVTIKNGDTITFANVQMNFYTVPQDI
jgi:CRP-like cAMP-binding protein